jgi:O-antigen ligase
MTRSEKIIWIFCAATSCQLAFQHPFFLLVAGERSNLFPGLLCFLTLIVAVVLGRRDAIRLRSPEFLISVALVVGVFHQKIIWHKLSMAYPAYRVENFPFSWSIVRKHPWLGIGLRSPRDQFMQDYQPSYPTVTKEQFARTTRDIVSADNQFLTLIVGLGLPFTLTYLAALGMLLARLGGLAFKPPARGASFTPWCSCFP